MVGAPSHSRPWLGGSVGQSTGRQELCLGFDTPVQWLVIGYPGQCTVKSGVEFVHIFIYRHGNAAQEKNIYYVVKIFRTEIETTFSFMQSVSQSRRQTAGPGLRLCLASNG